MKRVPANTMNFSTIHNFSFQKKVDKIGLRNNKQRPLLKTEENALNLSQQVQAYFKVGADISIEVGI